MAVTSAIAAVAGTAYSIYSGEKNAAAQDAAQKKAAKEADIANNKANQKKPDTIGALAAAMQAGKAGASGTLLTGSQGIDPSVLNLGKSTLLGQ